MKKEIWLGKKNLRFYYYRYKDSPYFTIGTFLVIIFVCLILLFNVLIPQFMNWFSIRKEVVATRERISIIKNNIQFMNSLDKAVLDSELQTASMAVPSERDFVLILNSISDAAIRSAISVDDFNFQVGNIDTAKSRVVDPAYKGLSVVRISLVVHGSFENIKRFVNELGSKLPLSEITSINGSTAGIAITIQFYQKSLPSIMLKNDVPLSAVSPEKKELLLKFSSWKPEPAPDFVDASSTPAGSESGTPLF